MSSDVIARLETLLNRVVARRALPRVTAPVAAPVVATSPAPKAIAPKPEARLEARRPEAAPVAEAPKPVAEAPKPVAEAPKPVAEAPKLVEPAADPTLVSHRTLDAVTTAPAAPESRTSLPLPPPVKIERPDDRIAASFAAGASVSPGFGDDDADHIETLAFRVGRALPKLAQVPAPPLPVTTREESPERRSERFSPSLPAAPVVAQISEPSPKLAPASLRALLQRSLALRPRG